MKENGMMSDDELNIGEHGFLCDFRSHCETGHDPLGRARAISQEQANIVPLRGQVRRRELFQIINNRAYCLREEAVCRTGHTSIANRSYGANDEESDYQDDLQ